MRGIYCGRTKKVKSHNNLLDNFKFSCQIQESEIFSSCVLLKGTDPGRCISVQGYIGSATYTTYFEKLFVLSRYPVQLFISH